MSDGPISTVKLHILAMEKWINEVEYQRDLFADDDDNKSLILFESAVALAKLHSEAARVVMAADEWEYLRSPLIPVRPYRVTQETRLPSAGGPLDGPGTDQAPVAPPIPTNDPTGEKEE